MEIIRTLGFRNLPPGTWPYTNVIEGSTSFATEYTIVVSGVNTNIKDLAVKVGWAKTTDPAAINELEEVISKSCPLPWSLEMLGDNPTMHTSESAEINQWLCSHIGQEQSVGVSFGTDGGYLSRAGYECVLYGPGNIAVAHKPDEYVPIVEMEECVQTIDAAVNYFCGVPA